MASPPQPSVRPAGDPTVATLLTWIVPGAGHLYLGRLRTAVLGFVVIEALYLLGLALSNGMFLEILPPELQGTFAAALTPEAGNLGMLLYHVKQFGYGTGEPRPWPASMDLGMVLTATSGVLNLLLMSRAHLDARAPERTAGLSRDPSLLAAATWVLPGLGQWLQGRRTRALVAGSALIALFVLGTFLSQGLNLDRERHFYYWAGQFLLGLPAIAAEFLHGHPRATSDVAYADAGIVLASAAGMLNVLLMLDAYSWSETHILGQPPERRGPRTSAPLSAEIVSETGADS